MEERKTLAWHETLEVHELTAFQTNGLLKLKMSVRKITDPELRNIYLKSIDELEDNLSELLQYYPMMPESPIRAELQGQDLLGFYAGDLLGFYKTAVRNYAIAITETATPALRKTLVNQLLESIKGHETIFNYMYKKGLYPAYDLPKLLSNDFKNAQKAISLEFGE